VPAAWSPFPCSAVVSKSASGEQSALVLPVADKAFNAPTAEHFEVWKPPSGSDSRMERQGPCRMDCQQTALHATPFVKLSTPPSKIGLKVMPLRQLTIIHRVLMHTIECSFSGS
jgi:hypothetical protein